MPAVGVMSLIADRQAVQRAERLALHDGSFCAPRAVARLLGDQRDDGIELRIERLDRVEMRVEHVDRTDGARADQRAPVRAPIGAPEFCRSCSQFPAGYSRQSTFRTNARNAARSAGTAG